MPRLPCHRRPSQRGAAMLMAVVSIAVLTALAVDLAYETQVRLRIAANARDELQAQALAQSAVNISRMVLAFQNQLDQNMALACPPQAGSGTAGGASPTSACPRPQIWSLIKVDPGLTQSLFAEGGDSAAGKAGASAPHTDFESQIEDEGQKINVQLDALQTSGRLGPQVEALLRMMCDAKWDPLFDRLDAEGQRYSRSDVIVDLRDWVDEDATSSSLTASFPGGNCSFVLPLNPFEQGFSDENFAYDRGPDRYKAKNARFDSLNELHLIAGVSDAFMAAFGDQLTAYLPREAGMNVNAGDLLQQLRVAALMAEPASLVKLLDPGFAAALHKALSDLRMGGFLTITPVQFAQVVEALGVKVRSEYLTQGPKSPFTDRSVVFRIRARGVAGDVRHESEAVVSFDPNLVPPAERLVGPAAAAQLNLGRLIRWREE
jgi:general secretion pathway protein K